METLRAVLIHLVMPAFGFSIYLWLCRKMHKSAIQKPPYIPLFILFIAYGGWLLILLTSIFWYWSGMASLGAIGLLTVSPIVMLIMAIYLFEQRKISTYHNISFVLSILYVVLVALIFISLFSRS